MLLDLLRNPARSREDDPPPPPAVVGGQALSAPRCYPHWPGAPLIVTPEPDGGCLSYCAGCGSMNKAVTDGEVMPWWLRHDCRDTA